MFAIGIDIGGTNTRIGLVSADGTLLEHKVIPTNLELPPQNVLDHLINECSPFLKQARAIGIGIAGQTEKGFLHFAPNLNWRNIPIREIITNKSGLPAIIENDVRAALWGEWNCGAGKGCGDLLFVSLGTGFGGAIVSGNRMITGDRSAAGEIGHLCIDKNGPRCSCGANGCLEAYVGGWAIEKESGGLSASEVFTLAKNNDPQCKEITQNVVIALSAGITSLLNILNPRCIIFGGGIFMAHLELIEQIKANVVGMALKIETESLEWKKQQLTYPGVVGSALYAMHRL